MAHKVYINYNDVQNFVQQVVAPVQEDNIKAWLNKRLSYYLMSAYPNVTELKTPAIHSYFKNDMPMVIQKAVENNEKIYRFKKSAVLKNKIPQVVDYLKHLESTAVNIKGMPFETAYQQSDKWHKSFAKPKKRKTVSVNPEGLNMVKMFDDGSFLAELVSKEQFAYESQMMAHCVESYYGRHAQILYGGHHSKILTYRTAENKPLLTIEVLDLPNVTFEVVQAKGFANKGFIPEEHIKKVLHYFHSLNRSVSYSDCLIFGHIIDQKPVIIMPEGSVFNLGPYDAEFEINCCVGLPKNAVFNGNVRLSEAQLPVLKDITVNGNLMIENSLIVALMDTVTVTGEIYISHSLTSIIAPHLQSKTRRF